MRERTVCQCCQKDLERVDYNVMKKTKFLWHGKTPICTECMLNSEENKAEHERLNANKEKIEAGSILGWIMTLRYILLLSVSAWFFIPVAIMCEFKDKDIFAGIAALISYAFFIAYFLIGMAVIGSILGESSSSSKKEYHYESSVEGDRFVTRKVEDSDGMGFFGIILIFAGAAIIGAIFLIISPILGVYGFKLKKDSKPIQTEISKICFKELRKNQNVCAKADHSLMKQPYDFK